MNRRHHSSTPLVVIMLDEPVHTDDRPFCSDPDCPCKSDAQAFEQHIAGPFARGEVTMREALRLFFGRQVN